MTASSATHGGTVCPACSVRNPSGATSCRGCQRYLATIPAPRPIVKTTPPVPTKAPVTTNVPAARPEDGTTRYLCAAAQRYQWFSDPVIAEFLVEQVRAVPPSPGLDSAAVLREAVAARSRRRVRDVVLLTLLAALTLLNPVAVVLWLFVASVVGKPRSAAGAVRRRMVAIVSPVAALLLVVALPIVKAATGVGLPPGDQTWWPSALLGLLLLVVLAADEFTVHHLVRKRFRAGEFTPDHHDASLAWERRMRGMGHRTFQAQLDRIAAADEYSPQATNKADVIVHRGPSPFIGAGLALETQTIALSLEPADDPSKPHGPDDINVTDLHAHVAMALKSLSSASSLVPGLRLEGILHREQVLIPADRLMDNINTSLGSAALKGVDQPPARHVALKAARYLAERPLEWARYYSCYRVESWNRDLATSCYFYAGTDQQMLYLELTHCILPPVMERFQEIDYIVDVGTGPISTTASALLLLPATVGRRLRSLARRLAPRKRRTRGVVADRYGASLSLREHVAGDGKPPLHFLNTDATRYVKIVDTALFRAIGNYLQQCGYDVVEFQKAVTATISQNSVNIAGGTFTNSNIAAGNSNANATGAGAPGN